MRVDVKVLTSPCPCVKTAWIMALLRSQYALSWLWPVHSSWVMMVTIFIPQYSHVHSLLDLLQSLHMWFHLTTKAEGRLIFRNPVFAPKKTHHVLIEKVKWLVLFREAVAVYSESCETHEYALLAKCGVTVIKVGGTCVYHWTFKC
jgi:hypothetical protein